MQDTWKTGMISSRMALRKSRRARAGRPRKKLNTSRRTTPQAVAIMCRLDPKSCNVSQALCSGGLMKENVITVCL